MLEIKLFCQLDTVLPVLHSPSCPVLSRASVHVCTCACVYMCMCVRVWGWECCTPASIRETPVGNQRTEDRSLAPVASCFSAGIPAGSTPRTTSSCPAAPCHSSSSSYPTSETMLPSDALQEWSYYPKLLVPGCLIILWRFPQP